MLRSLLFLLTASVISLHAQSRSDYRQLSPEERALARDIFRELIEIKTTYSVGTAKAVTAMAARLRQAGFSDTEVQIAGPTPAKQNLVVRLKGSGKAKPILLIAHLDVVEARREDWSTDPFTFVEKDGYFYGRGTSDCKAEAVDLLMQFIRMKKQHVVPSRDIIVALTADEEDGGEETNGIAWLIRSRRDLIDAEYCINTDAGGGDISHGKPVIMGFQTSEKVYFDLQLEARDKGGHSSLPVVKNNAIYRLAHALMNIAAYQFPVRLNETSRIYLQRMAERETSAVVANAMKALASAPDDSTAAVIVAAKSPVYNAQMRTTAVATMVTAGHAPNALPQMARANVNCRILPGESPDSIEATIRRIVADTGVAVTRVRPPKPSPATPLRDDLLKAVEHITVEMWPGVTVIPVMSTGASDAVYLRRAGMPVYGISGMFFDMDDNRAHGRDERIGVKEFYDGVEFMGRLLTALSLGNTK